MMMSRTHLSLSRIVACLGFSFGVCYAPTVWADLQFHTGSTGRAEAPPPPLPPPAHQPVLATPPLAPPPVTSAPPPPAPTPARPWNPPPNPPPPPPYEASTTMTADLHLEISQLLAALDDHRRHADILAIRHRNRGLIAGGATLLSLGYLGAAVAGALFYSSAQGMSTTRDLSTERAASGTLFIPVLGPFVSSLVYREPEWALTWSLTSGVAQLGGVFMMAAGMYSNRKLPRPLVGARLMPVKTPTTTGLVLGGAF